MSIKISVLGAGPGGYNAAIQASRLGADVTVIEKDNPGGTCLNRGCIPSKILKATAELMEKFQRAGEFGITVNGNIYPDITAIMARKQKIIDIQRKGITELLRRHNVSVISGDARVIEPGIVEINSHEGGSESRSYDKCIIATGSLPGKLQGFSYDGISVLSSNDVLELQTIPESMLIIGGGVIGCEFASIFSALGSKITILEYQPELLPGSFFDVSCTKILHREMNKRNIRILTGHAAAGFKTAGDKLIVTATSVISQDATPVIIDVEKIVICTGRSPLNSLPWHERIPVKTDTTGWVIANNHLETTCSNIYAIGDILGPSRPMLAHVAAAEGRVAAENACGNKTSMDYSVIPSVVYTIPEIAVAGISETMAITLEKPVKTKRVLFRTTGQAHAIGSIEGEVKLISDPDTGIILGIQIIGAHASELIAEGVLAIKKKISTDELSGIIHAHPSLSEAIQEVSVLLSEN